jgi:spermidine synthase
MLMSGAAGLVWQLLWTVQLGLALGHEMIAVLAVLAAFFGGLALGALWLGERIARSARPARWYAALEAVIALWAALLSLIWPLVTPMMARLIGEQPSALWHWAVAFAVPMVVLAPATLAMGATLPAVDRQLRMSEHARLGSLYAANTAGAMLGVLLAVFVCIPWLGLAHTAWLFASVNALCAVFALWLWSAGTPGAQASAQPPRHEAQALAEPDDGVHAGRDPSRRRIVATLGLTGLLGIGYEVLAVRVLSQVTENTVYTYAVLLAVYLLGTATGAWLYQWRRDRRAQLPGAATPRTPVLQQLLLALAAAMLLGGASLWWADRLDGLPSSWLGLGLASAAAGEALAAVAALLLPTLVMGALFTHLCELGVARGLPLGRALAVNTLGAALAPLLVGVMLVPWAGAGASLCVLIAGYLLLQGGGGWRQPSAWLVTGALALMMVLAGPLRFVDVPPGGRILSYRDGSLAAVSVVEDAEGVARLHINNRVQEGSSASGQVEIRLAQLPLMLHPAPQRALFLGLGTGFTARAAALDPHLSVQAVELLPEVIEASQLFARRAGTPDDAMPAAMPVALLAADARRYVQSGSQRYDVVVADLFHPARSGAGSLYTVEHFSAVRERLAPGGLFCQWVALHQMDLATLRSIVAAFMQVYPQGLAVLASNSLDTPVIGLIGQNQAAPWQLSHVQSRLQAGTPRQQDAWRLARMDDAYAVLGSVLAGPQVLRSWSEGVQPNTDDHPVVAWDAPLTVHGPQTRPRERLASLLAQWTPAPGPWLDGGDALATQRLSDYWEARRSYLQLGMSVRPDPDPVVMLQRLLVPLLQVLSRSPDFRPAAEPLVALARAAQVAAPDLSAQVLADLRRVRAR